MINKVLINKYSILNEAKHFFPRIFQNYLVFIPAKRYIKYFSGTTQIDSSKSNETPEENIENITKSNNNFAPTFIDHHVLTDINFNGHSFLNNIYIPKKVMNIYISYALNPWLRNINTDYSLHYNGTNSFLFVDATRIFQFKAKDSEMKNYTLCLGNISKDLTINNMKKARLKEIVIFLLLILIQMILTKF